MRFRQRTQLLVVLLFMVMALISIRQPAQAQESTSLSYGESVNGEITDNTEGRSQTYSFTGKANDVVTIIAKRTSGDLAPVIVLGYQDTDKNLVAVTANYRADDDATATIADYTLKGDHDYFVLVTRRDGSDGATKGEYSLTLEGTPDGKSPCMGLQPDAESVGETPTDDAKQWSQPDQVVDPTHTYCAIMTTDNGLIIIELYPDAAPKNVNNFVFLAQKGFYDNITWHLVIRDFVAQSGDPTGTSKGGPGYNVQLEIDPDVKYDREGRLGAARAIPRDSAGSQFFITMIPLPHLDAHPAADPDSEGYTIMGQVVEGMDVAKAITPFESDKNPSGKGDALVSVRIVDLTAQNMKSAK